MKNKKILTFLITRLKLISIAIVGILLGTLVASFVTFVSAYNSSSEFKSATTVSTGTLFSLTLWNDVRNQIGNIMDIYNSLSSTIITVGNNVSVLTSRVSSYNGAFTNLSNVVSALGGSIHDANIEMTTMINGKFGVIEDGKWCSAGSGVINCQENVPVTSETDPKFGNHTGNFISKWSPGSSQFVDSVIYESGGNVGINIQNPKVKLDINGEARFVGSNVTCTSSIAGAVRYNTGNTVIEYCNGTLWGEIGPTWDNNFTPQEFNFGENITGAAPGKVYTFTTNVKGFLRPLTFNCPSCGGVALNGVWSNSGNIISGVKAGDQISIMIVSSEKELDTVITRMSLGGANSSFSITTRPFVCGDKLYDSRNAKYYTTKKFGSLCWMTQTLNYGTMVNIGSAQSTGANVTKWCPSNNEIYCDQYGAHYFITTATNGNNNPGVQGICPGSGWYVPGTTEWYGLWSNIQSSVSTNIYKGGSSDFNFIETTIQSNGAWLYYNNNGYFGPVLVSGRTYGGWFNPSSSMNTYTGWQNGFADTQYNMISTYASPLRCVRSEN